MRPPFRAPAWVACALLLAAPPLAAQPLVAQLPPASASGAAASGPALPSPIRVGFEAAWALHPELRSATLRRDASAAALAAARRWTAEAPSLEFAHRSDRLTGNDGVREQDAGVAVPLWLPGERALAQAAARSDGAALDARLDAARWRLAAEVRDAHWALQRARLGEQLATERLGNARTVAADVARRVRAGDLARADSHQAEGVVAGAETALAEASADAVEAARAWSALTGLPPPPPGAAGEPQPRADAVAGVHPALRELAARADLAARQLDLASVQTRGNPELTVGAVRERDGAGERTARSLVVGLRVPLGRSSTSDARIATAGADRLEAEAQLALETTRLQALGEAARARVEWLERAARAAERRAVLARETRGFFDASFRLGETDLPTRLRVELEAVDAERQAARSRLDVDAAISQWRQALGLIPE